MTDLPARPFAAFDGPALLASGTREDVALAVKRALDGGARGPVLAFDGEGRQIDFDIRGSEAEVLARIAPPPPEPRGRGRPKLGVVAREVTLLPRHWDWLATQPGGASVALRKLVEHARGGDQDRRRAGRDAAYRFGSAMAGDLPNFEDAMRALYAGDGGRLRELAAAWPADVRGHLLSLLEA